MDKIDFSTGEPVSNKQPEHSFILTDQGFFRIRSGPDRYVIVVVPVWRLNQKVMDMAKALTKGENEQVEAVIVLNQRKEGFLPLLPLFSGIKGKPKVYAADLNNRELPLPGITHVFESYHQLPEFLEFEEADFHFPDPKCGFVYANFFDPNGAGDSSVCLGYDIYLTEKAMEEMHDPETSFRIFGAVHEEKFEEGWKYAYEATGQDSENPAALELVLLNWIAEHPGNLMVDELREKGIYPQLVGDMDPDLQEIEFDEV